MDIENWKYHNPVAIYSGPDSLKLLRELLPTKGNVLLVTTKGWIQRGIMDIVGELTDGRRLSLYSDVTANPELDDIDKAISSLDGYPLTSIIAIGGGSAIDAAKAINVGIDAGFKQPLNRVFRDGHKHHWNSRLPLLAVPTTAGTGAEVTPFATVWDSKTKRKFSVTGDQVYPTAALLDFKLTLTLPYRETLYTALDTISHALESIWNKSRNNISMAYATRALELACGNLHDVLDDYQNLLARKNMQDSSLLAGLAISKTRTAIAHSMSYPLTIHYKVPHGLAVSFALIPLIDIHLASEKDHHTLYVLNQTKKLLTSLGVARKLLEIVTAKQVLGLLEEMFEPSRFGNYLHHMDADKLHEIISNIFASVDVHV